MAVVGKGNTPVSGDGLRQRARDVIFGEQVELGGAAADSVGGVVRIRLSGGGLHDVSDHGERSRSGLLPSTFLIPGRSGERGDEVYLRLPHRGGM